MWFPVYFALVVCRIVFDWLWFSCFAFEVVVGVLADWFRLAGFWFGGALILVCFSLFVVFVYCVWIFDCLIVLLSLLYFF